MRKHREGPGTGGADEGFDQAISGLPLFSARLLREIYEARDFLPAWSSTRAQSMLDLADGSVAHGLEPNDFNADAIRALLAEMTLKASDNVEERWRAELILSDALLRYLHHLQYGKHNPKEINPDWTFVDSVDAADLRVEMQDALAAADLTTAVDAMLPKAPFYEQLKLGYGRYLALNERLQLEGGWTPIPGGANLKIGMRDPRLRRIRDQLTLLDGYEFPPTAEPDIYDQALYDAIRELQGRSGLAQDGIIGPRTLAALNHPFDDRLASIRANLERMRWLYHELPSDYLLVDITAFELEMVRDHQPVWSTRAVVGTEKNQTPMFRDAMEHLVFNPTWSVPRSIQKTMRGVPGDYRVIDRRTGRRVYPSNPTDHRRYRLVQQPGPRNALGRVKFMFPNGHAIYLHDTPSRHLFARGRRSYSHGCVRVQEPLDLAREILAEQDWDMGAIQRVVDRGRTRYVNLNEHLPVLLYYLTARADEEGRIGFRHDVYGRDPSLLAALEVPPDADRIVFRELPETEAEDEDEPQQTPLAGTTPMRKQRTDTSIPPKTHTDERDGGLQPEVATQDGLTASAKQRPAPDPWWGLSMSAQIASARPDLTESQRLRPELSPADLSADLSGEITTDLDEPTAGWRSHPLRAQGSVPAQLDLRPALIDAAAPGG
ncbi:L,D-transpeptidase family protein [Halochromatium sp.]